MAKRILIIDDDRDILSIMDIVFGEAGYQTILLNKGTTIDHILELNPDMILLDVQITGYDKTGDQICLAIRDEEALQNVPVLLVSGEPDLRELAGSCGASGYVNKPFEIDSLLARVKEFIS